MSDRSVHKSTDPDEKLPLSSPYGPQYGGVDEAAGGADSSPYENAPTGERTDAAATPPNRARGQGESVNG